MGTVAKVMSDQIFDRLENTAIVFRDNHLWVSPRGIGSSYQWLKVFGLSFWKVTIVTVRTGIRKSFLDVLSWRC